MKTWMIIYFNAVHCHPLYVKISQIMYVNSLFLKTKKKN